MQRCEPTVREECSSQLETVCQVAGAVLCWSLTVHQDQCGERCREEDRRVCLTIPVQECSEQAGPVCRAVPRQQCRQVNTASRDCTGLYWPARWRGRSARRWRPRRSVGPAPGCSASGNPDNAAAARCCVHLYTCLDIPTHTCQVVSQCRQEPRQQCEDRVRETCDMACQPVYWCKMCHGKLTRI